MQPTSTRVVVAAQSPGVTGTAQEQNVPAYIVFTDSTPVMIAELLPTDDAAPVAIPGGLSVP